MEQLTQLLKDGTMELLEVPYPALMKGQVLVKNHFSLISAGTEGKTVKDARLGYIAKARARREDVKKVIEAARTFGVLDTYRMVMSRLETPSPLGYSCAGEVIAVADDVIQFRIGDLVACGGSTANHAEIVAVPVNLCVKIPPNVLPEHAAFTTLGAIALQGVRQADLRLGENAVVIGLGLIGQLTVQLLQAAGVKAIGIDVRKEMVDSAAQNGCEHAFLRDEEGLEAAVMQLTGGYGTDAVIITAATDSNDPVDLAGELCRQKGKVIVVGAVPTGFKRKNYYNKELELKMSCSYGPGRYDKEYEEKGIDYPYAWTRWTENRNMQAFADLLGTEKINVAGLLTQTFNFSDAPQAYQMVLDRQKFFLGIVLKYDTAKNHRSTVVVKKPEYIAGSPAIGFIGAGTFAQNFLLPALKGSVSLVGVANARAHKARAVADKFGFSYCTGNSDEILNDQNINTVFIATRHNTHAEYVIKALRHGKNVFVEKPLCLTMDELSEIIKTYGPVNSRLMVGYNRRFSPWITRIRSALPSGVPLAIQYRINAGPLAADHWIHDPETGGGRILGEVCHFIDLCYYLSGSMIISVSAAGLRENSPKLDTVTINLIFENGSIANISYFSNGNKLMPKERLEVFSSGLSAVCDDFKSVTIFGKSRKHSSGLQDKGHKQEVAAFIESVKKGVEAPIAFNEIVHVSAATFNVLESLAQQGKEVPVSLGR